MNSNLYKLFLVTFLFLNMSFCYAEYLAPVSVTNISPAHWYINFDLGLNQFAKLGTYNTPTAPPVSGTDTYRYNKNKKKLAIALGVGYRWQRKTRFWLPNYSLGLRYTYYLANKLSGNYQFPMTQPINFTYETHSQAILGVGKLSILKWHSFMPYVIGGLGVSLNRFSNYQDASVVFPDNIHIFSNKSSFKFAYLMGLGIDYQLNTHWQVGLEYDYTNLGKVQSGQNKNGKILPISLKAQTIGLNIHYYFA